MGGHTGNRGGAGSEGRRGRRKRRRDLDAVGMDPVGLTPRPISTATAADDPPLERGVDPVQDVLPVPPLGEVGQGLDRTRSERGLVLPPRELASFPELQRALGAVLHRSWTVGGLIRTLGSWFFAGSDEARVLRDDLGARMREMQGLRQEMSSMRTAFERASYDRERYRRERDSLRRSNPAPLPASHAAPHASSTPTIRDPYADY